MPAAEPVALPTANGWYWQEDDGTWHRFEQSTSGISSITIDNRIASSTNGNVLFNRVGCSYTIDTRSMIQTNLTTGFQRPVKRVSPMPKSPTTSTPMWFCEAADGKWKLFDDDFSN